MQQPKLLIFQIKFNITQIFLTLIESDCNKNPKTKLPSQEDVNQLGCKMMKAIIIGKDFSVAKFFLYKAYIFEQSSLDKMKGIR